MSLLSLPGLRITRKRIYPRVFDLFVSLGIDYIDCYHAALLEAQGQQDLYSFDNDFDRVPFVHRHEPLP